MPEAFQPYFALVVVVATFVVMYTDKFRPGVVLFSAVMVFMVTGILTPDIVLSGFSNESIASILLLILITAGLRKSFNIESIFNSIYHGVSSYRGFLLRMMLKVAALSSVVNNTPVVALMTPYVFGWGKKNNIAPSKLLIPLSFATIFGGMITLIGTSTTLVLDGFIEEEIGGHINLLHLSFIGAAVTITGILFLTLAGNRLLPDRSDVIDEFKENVREYLVETMLSDSSAMIGKTVIEAGLRNLKGVFLVEIVRGEDIIYPVEPSEVIEANDILIFAGQTEDIVDLVNNNSGLRLPPQTFIRQEKIEVVEAVTTPNSPLIGKRVKDSDFRNRFDAAIIAIHRNGEKLRGKIGEIKISPGDLLLIFAGTDFFNRTEYFREIYVVSKLREIVKPRSLKRNIMLGLLILAIILLMAGVFNLFTSLMIIFFLMASFRMISLQDVQRELDMNLIAILVFSLAMGKAILVTGAGDLVAENFLSIFQPMGLIGVVTGLVILTTILTSFITNVGAVSIIFPLAYSLSQQLGIPGMPLYLALAFSASAAFLTPIGYQTNLIIYGPGGYNFKDFLKVGFPVTVVYLCTVMAVLIILYGDLFFGI
ncbi:SLC13 family permease [Roseivirga sp. BDSF3-8]|uniref:SLC13 family permease n=1 Tax=Roseivirga sp. BDSF3-8 TaxID=3241598 RepID=UPI003531E207